MGRRRDKPEGHLPAALLIALVLAVPAQSQELAPETVFAEPTDELVDRVFAPAAPAMVCNCPQCRAVDLTAGIQWDRDLLLGDDHAWRKALERHGLSVEADITHIYQGVTSGGRDELFDHSTFGDLVIRTDFGALGLQEGLFLKVRGQGRIRDAINRQTGALLPAALSASLPTDDVEKSFALTDFVFTQEIDENFAVFAGKIDTLDGDQNAFASGRGKTQFLNSGFVYNPVLAASIPYSALATGFTYSQGRETLFKFTVVSPADSPADSGFNELFEEGMILAAEARLPVRFRGLPGHQLVGGTWNTGEVTVDRDPRFVWSPAIPSQETRDGAWSLYYNFDQYLYVAPERPLRGWGVFGRAGIGDGDTNPIRYFVSIGVGGSSPLTRRPRDTWGIGYYYLGFSDDFPDSAGYEDEQGLELYYRAAVTRGLSLTPDLQIIDGGSRGTGTATVLGIRARMTF